MTINTILNCSFFGPDAAPRLAASARGAEAGVASIPDTKKRVHGCGAACDAARAMRRGDAANNMAGSDHPSFMMRTLYRDARLHVLMMSPYNISSRHDRVIAADQQQHFVVVSVYIRRSSYVTSADGSTALLLLMSSSSSSCRLLCRRYSSSRTSWRV